MNMSPQKFILTGTRSLFMHSYNVMESDKLSAERKTPGRKGVAGDDRDPVWTWKTYLYVDDGAICWPAQSLMAMMRKGGVDFKTQGKKTLKGESQASILFEDEYLELKNHRGDVITAKQIDAIDNDSLFQVHCDAVEKLGCVLDVRPAKIARSTHIRVRLKYLTGWQIFATALVDTDRIPAEVFNALLTYCGSYVGIGDWRPSAPQSPGPFGKFTVEMV